jgi:hypothetical protein
MTDRLSLRDLEQRLALGLAHLETKPTIRAAIIALVGLSALLGALPLLAAARLTD